MEKYICVHGHFYQPPRENPWLEDVEYQESAYPYHDWNERINSECYAPNTASRIVDADGKIIIMGNNYARISFNFGPTLLSWMQKHSPDIYAEVVDADLQSRKRFSGHGSAMAQAYNHLIMPLANDRDKQTQVIWGIRDFQCRFNRPPEGMWLPETSANVATLDILAEHGIKFTVLSPYQAKRARRSGTNDWYDASGGRIDPKRPYLCRLPSGRTIALFFYDGPISQDVAFGGLLERGENLANRLLSAFVEDNSGHQLVHIATDGETYGHHHKHGDMALGYCLYYIRQHRAAKITNYGEYLEKFPPEFEAEIFDNSSWSCVHGVERWRSNCGCNTGSHPGWNQEWRAPLRNAQDWLRDTLSPIFENQAGKYLSDPWAARNDYIDVILDRSPMNIDWFFRKHAVKELSSDERIASLKLLEMQRNALLMYTSCGWFFDEVSGIETVQVLQYSCRAIQLAEEATGSSIEPLYVKLLEKIPTNIPEFKDGANIYQMFAKPSKIDFLRVGAHYAISSLFNEYPENTRIYCYAADTDIYDKRATGTPKIFIFRGHIKSEITQEKKRISAAALHLGDQNINCGVRYFINDEESQKMHDEIATSFDNGNILAVIRAMETHFGTYNYSLMDLFRDEQKMILNKIVSPTLEQIRSSVQQTCDNNCMIIDFFKSLNIPIPKDLYTIISYRTNAGLEKALTDGADIAELRKEVNEIKRWQLDIDRAKLSLVSSTWINRMLDRMKEHPDDEALIDQIADVLDLVRSIDIPLNLWKAQNIYYRIDVRLHEQMQEKAGQGHDQSRAWVAAFHKLGEQLRIKEMA